MKTPNAVSDDVALLLVREYLSALPRYPYRIEGEQRLATIVAEVAVSLTHARAFLEIFDQQCPTPREIRDEALIHKGRMFPPPDPRVQWEKELEAEGTKPGPVQFEPIKMTDSHLIMMKKAADRLDVPLHKLKHFSFGQIFAAWEDLGYKLNGDQRKIREGATIPPRKPVVQQPGVRRITQADIDGARGA